MTTSTRKILLLLTAAAHAVVGAGAGERVVYFGAAHEHAHEATCRDEGHAHSTLLHLLPVSTAAPAGHDDHHDHDCPHVHVRGQDAPRASAGSWQVPPAPIAAPTPVFLSAARVVASPRSCVNPPSAAPPHPPDAALVRLTV